MPVTGEDKDLLNELFIRSEDNPLYDSPDNVLETPTLVIDIDEVDGEAKKKAEELTEKLSNYYFDQKYIERHPYIPNKIAQEMDNVRRLIKMLSVNEKAQDTLITNITMNAGKGALYQSLTALQDAMLKIQRQLNDLISDIENIFKEMQSNAEETFEEKPKELSLTDGSMIVRGSKEFINSLNETYYKKENIEENVDKETGEVFAEDLLKESVAI